jgi:hypothetical protein
MGSLVKGFFSRSGRTGKTEQARHVINTQGGLSPQSIHSRQLFSFSQKRQLGRTPCNTSPLAAIALSTPTPLLRMILSIKPCRRMACCNSLDRGSKIGMSKFPLSKHKTSLPKASLIQIKELAG